MFKHTRFLSIFILLGILFTAMPAGQSALVTFFGPEIFVRGTGQPVEEVREFSTAGFLGPYYLHLRNGDEFEENRMSSAEVWLNDELIFGPEDFSQQVWAYDIEVDLQVDNILKVKAASAPGSFLKIWIEGTSMDPYHFYDVTIHPEGGKYILQNGIVLDAPQGAVNEMFTFSIRRLRPEEVQPILDSYGVEKYFLAGFEVGSDYFVFNEPITVSLPSEALMSAADLPFHYEVNPEHMTHSLTGPDSYLNSLVSITANGDCQNTLFHEHDPETGATVSFCVPDLDPDHPDIVAAIKDILKDNAGVKCNVPQPPCVCTNIEVIEVSRDYIVDEECEYYDVKGKAIYHDCGGIVNSWSFTEDKRPMIMTDPPVTEGEFFIINEGDSPTFLFWLEDKLGNEVPSVNLKAEIINDTNGALEIVQEGPNSITLKGISCGNAELVINAGCENTKTINISVGNVKEIKIDPPQNTTLELCETLQLTAKVYDHSDDLIENIPVRWTYTSPDTIAVDLDQDTGYLEANGAGQISVRAQACSEDDVISLTINPAVDLQPDGTSEIYVGETMPILVRVEEECGIAVENPALDWTIPPGGIISVDLSDPSNYTVTGVELGTATLTVTYKGISDSIEISVFSEVGSVDLEIYPDPLVEGETGNVDVYVYDTDGNNIPDYPIQWEITPSGIISFNTETLTITGNRPGWVTVTATAGGKSASYTIMVEPFYDLRGYAWIIEVYIQGNWTKLTGELACDGFDWNTGWAYFERWGLGSCVWEYQDKCVESGDFEIVYPSREFIIRTQFEWGGGVCTEWHNYTFTGEFEFENRNFIFGTFYYADSGNPPQDCEFWGVFLHEFTGSGQVPFRGTRIRTDN